MKKFDTIFPILGAPLGGRQAARCDLLTSATNGIAGIDTGPTDFSHDVAMHPVRRSEERVTPLELFFDLVLVLAITQCTALMAHEASWEGIGHGLLLLGLLWWAWVGYAWLTSVVDPEEGSVRLAVFAVMAGLLVAALTIPGAFDDLATEFTLAYAVVRFGHIVLMMIASRQDPTFRHSTRGLALSTGLGCAVLVLGAQLDGDARTAVWLAALLFDIAGPAVIDPGGWRLVPGHFAERHALIVIVALGESIVAIGVGAEAKIDGGVIAAAVLGMARAATQWWAYFDVAALLAAAKLAEATPGSPQNRMARDCYSYLHLPVVAAIVLVAFGLKGTLGHVGDPLSLELSVGLAGGAALYLLAQVAFKLRALGSRSTPRLVASAVLLLLVPVGREVDAIVALALVTSVMAALVAFETVHDADARDVARHGEHQPNPLA